MRKHLSFLFLLLSLSGTFAAPAWSAESSDATAPSATAMPARPIPFKHEPQSVGGQVGQSILTLALLIGVAAGTLYVAKKYLPQLNRNTSGGKRLTLIEVLRLTPKTTLFVVRFDDTTLLLGQHGDSVNVLKSQTTTEPLPNTVQA